MTNLFALARTNKVGRPSTIPFGNPAKTRKRPLSRAPTPQRKRLAISGQTGSRTRKGTALAGTRVSFFPALACTRFRFAILLLRVSASLCRCFMHLRLSESVSPGSCGYEVPFCAFTLARHVLIVSIFPALAIILRAFSAKRNGGGFFVMDGVVGISLGHGDIELVCPRECKQSRATLHHSVWPPCQNGKETAFPSPTAITKRAGNFLPNGILNPQGHSACGHKGFVFPLLLRARGSVSPGSCVYGVPFCNPALASQRPALPLLHALAVIGFRFLRLLRARGSVLRSCSCESVPRFGVVSYTCASAPCFFGKTEWRWVFR